LGRHASFMGCAADSMVLFITSWILSPSWHITLIANWQLLQLAF
jgi:hypothetical protein